MMLKALGRGNAQELINAMDTYIANLDFSIDTKQQHITVALICSAHNGWKLTRFDVESLGDHCFNSTVSQISRNVPVERCVTKRPTKFGKDTPCKEYWLKPENIGLAEASLKKTH